MIREEICTYEVCKLAKEKGFDVPTFGYYRIDTEDWYRTDVYDDWNDSTIRYSAPTQSLLQRWLREEKGIIVEIIAQPTCSTSKKNCYWWIIKQNSNGLGYQYEECSYFLYDNGGYFNTYELALEDALKDALKNSI